MKAKRAKDKEKGKRKQPRRAQKTVGRSRDGPGPSCEPSHNGSEENVEPAVRSYKEKYFLLIVLTLISTKMSVVCVLVPTTMMSWSSCAETGLTVLVASGYMKRS